MATEDLPVDLKSPARLANRGTPPAPVKMERFLRALGITGTAYRRWAGNQSFGEFINMNPTWTLRAWQILILENAERLSYRGQNLLSAQKPSL